MTTTPPAFKTRVGRDGVTVYSVVCHDGAVYEQRGKSGRDRTIPRPLAFRGTCKECGARTMRGECLLCEVSL